MQNVHFIGAGKLAKPIEVGQIIKRCEADLEVVGKEHFVENVYVWRFERVRNDVFVYILAYDLGEPFACLRDNIVAIAYKIAFKRQRQIFSRFWVRLRVSYDVLFLKKILGRAVTIVSRLLQCNLHYLFICHISCLSIFSR
jgi:hypothetical protein